VFHPVIFTGPFVGDVELNSDPTLLIVNSSIKVTSPKTPLIVKLPGSGDTQISPPSLCVQHPVKEILS